MSPRDGKEGGTAALQSGPLVPRIAEDLPAMLETSRREMSIGQAWLVSRGWPLSL